MESDDGQSNLPGVHSGQNGFGAAGPMQIGIGGASTDTWGGAPVHPASEKVSGVATDANGDGVASVYEPADAIAGAAKYLLAHGVQNNVSGAIFAYNHLQSYVQTVLYWAGVYSRGGYTVSNTTTVSAPECLTSAQTSAVPNQLVSTVIGFAREQLGKPYLWGGTGPDSFDCSGLMMMAYRAAGISIPRTSQQQWAWGPKIPASQVQPGRSGVLRGLGRHADRPGSRRPGHREGHDDRGLRDGLRHPDLRVRHLRRRARRRHRGRFHPPVGPLRHQAPAAPVTGHLRQPARGAPGAQTG